MTTVCFTVPFVHGLQRPRFSGHAYDTRRNREDKALMAAAYREACRKAGLGKPWKAPKGVPVGVEVTVRQPLPKSRPRRVTREPHVVKPDADNALKLCLDALNGVAYEDDAQVTYAACRKLPRERGVGPETTVTVTRIWSDGGVA